MNIELTKDELNIILGSLNIVIGRINIYRGLYTNIKESNVEKLFNKLKQYEEN